MRALALTAALASVYNVRGCIQDGTSVQIRNALNITSNKAKTARGLFRTNNQNLDSGYALGIMASGSLIFFNANDPSSSANATLNGDSLNITGKMWSCNAKTGNALCNPNQKVICDVSFAYSNIVRNVSDGSLSANKFVSGTALCKGKMTKFDANLPFTISSTPVYGANSVSDSWCFSLQCNYVPPTLSTSSQNSTATVLPSWTSWTDWSTCSVTCGNGLQNRTRSCNGPTGMNCSGDSSESQPCALTPCAINGAWSSWGDWSTCSVTCGNGTQQATRNCTDPSPSNGGQNCVGDSSISQSCIKNPCVVDGAWSIWSSWSSCTNGCMYTTRTRTCSNPTPENGGANCIGDSSQKTTCYFLSGCEGNWPLLQCPNGSLIAYGTVKYGRWSYGCPNPINGWGTQTYGLNIDMVNAPSYQMTDFNSRWGDPLRNTFKQYEVTYACGIVKTISGCENDPIVATCPEGLVVSGGNVLYGRWTTANCPGWDYGNTKSANWYGFPRGNIGRNTTQFYAWVFGDPRPNVYKQWVAIYNCAPTPNC